VCGWRRSAPAGAEVRSRGVRSRSAEADCAGRWVTSHPVTLIAHAAGRPRTPCAACEVPLRGAKWADSGPVIASSGCQRCTKAPLAPLSPIMRGQQSTAGRSKPKIKTKVIEPLEQIDECVADRPLGLVVGLDPLGQSVDPGREPGEVMRGHGREGSEPGAPPGRDSANCAPDAPRCSAWRPDCRWVRLPSLA
jgi:hypothetical protein